MKVFDVFVSCLITELVARKTIIISSDGFRWDYYGRYNTPGLDALKSAGVHVKNLKNAFATVTFPNHFTLVTGMYEENHGIIDNEMYDPVFNESFTMATTDPKWWKGGEPIWVTASKSGIHSVCVNWVSCSIENQRPTYWNPYNGSIPYHDRVDQILEKLKDTADLGILYFEEPDHSCHMYGPDSSQVRDAIIRVDQSLQYLLSQIDLDEVNVVFTSDHGGYEVSRARLVVLDNFTNRTFNVAANGAVAHVWVPEGEIDSLLTDFASIHPNEASCERKEDIRNGLHYSHNRRIAPIVCIGQLGWSIVKSEQEREDFSLHGSHGWDASKDENSPMRPIFIAAGPDLINVQDSEPLAPFANIHVYPLLYTLVGLPEGKLPEAVNGTVNAIEHLLRRQKQSTESYVVLQW